MRVGSPGFQSERLTEAREARAITKVALAQLVGRASSTLSNWESGRQTPDPEALEDLARALNVSKAFFLKPPSRHGVNPIFFRSLVSATASYRKRCGARLHWMQDISITIQEWVDLPLLNIPNLELPHFKGLRTDDIEAAADACRKHWRLGCGPISDVILAMENAGIVVAYDEVESEALDGMSAWSELDGRPYVLLASDKKTCVRSRFDAAHELAHLILHRNIDSVEFATNLKLIETQAHRFASAFLMPSDSFPAEIPVLTLDGILALKERWKVSLGAMVYRCKDLEIITDEHASRLFKARSARGWRRREPLDDTLEQEATRLLSRSIKLIIEDAGVSIATLLDAIRLPAHDVEVLAGLPIGYLANGDCRVVDLPQPRLKKETAEKNDNDCKIVPFRRI
ncbi:XRE family transcriptional regulator [Oleispirillum naphthae]|uniref:XRE family transcriptional regulator n=1 Tax=Oleispirillum naphthae TaxID=2838853 RepID=UPI00308258BC